MGDNQVNKDLLEAIELSVQRAVSAAFEKWQAKLDSLDERCTLLKEENDHLKAKISNLSTVTAINLIDAEVYSRKWNLVIHGISGDKGENEALTNEKVRDMACQELHLPAAATKQETPFAACHRLSQEKDAGIVVKFANLSDRNTWLSRAPRLKKSKKNLSISPDIPPILKPLKNDILQHRKNLPPAQKQNSRVKYSKTWPYISLHLPDGKLYKPEISLQDITKNFYTHPAPAIHDCSLF